MSILIFRSFPFTLQFYFYTYFHPLSALLHPPSTRLQSRSRPPSRAGAPRGRARLGRRWQSRATPAWWQRHTSRQTGRQTGSAEPSPRRTCALGDPQQWRRFTGRSCVALRPGMSHFHPPWRTRPALSVSRWLRRGDLSSPQKLSQGRGLFPQQLLWEQWAFLDSHSPPWEGRGGTLLNPRAQESSGTKLPLGDNRHLAPGSCDSCLVFSTFVFWAMEILHPN